MTTFLKDPTPRKPFGKNQYLRSVRDVKTLSRWFVAESMPETTIDGTPTKFLQSGTILAEITSGPNIGGVGPFQGAGTVEVQTITEGTAITAGTYKITLGKGSVQTSALAFNATAAQVETAVRAALAASSDVDDRELANSITVTGGPVDNVALTVTYGNSVSQDWPALTVDATALTGTVTVATATPGVAGAADGRQTTGNIVGICDTFLPWQLNERDVEVAVVYECAAVQAWCIEYSANGLPIALTNTTRDAILALPKLAILFP